MSNSEHRSKSPWKQFTSYATATLHCESKSLLSEITRRSREFENDGKAPWRQTVKTQLWRKSAAKAKIDIYIIYIYICNYSIYIYYPFISNKLYDITTIWINSWSEKQHQFSSFIVIHCSWSICSWKTRCATWQPSAGVIRRGPQKAHSND